METKMKSKKGKAIIGIAMTAIMLASVFAAMVPTASAQGNEYQEDKGYINLAANAGESVKVLRGEMLNFSEELKTIYGYSEGMYGKTRETTSDNYDTADIFSDADCEYVWFVDMETGDTPTHADSGYNSSIDVLLSLDKPRLEIEIQNEAGKSIESTTEREMIYIHISSNLFADDQIVIKEENPKGHVSTLLSATNFGDAQDYNVSTEDWRSGEHEIWVKTAEDGDYARGLDISSDKDTITIFKEEITIEAENEEPVVAEEVLITVRAPPDQLFNFITNHPEDVTMTSKQDNPLGLPSGTTETMDNAPVSGKFSDTTDEDGLYKFVVKFTDDRTFKFEVEYNAEAEEDEIELDVGKADVVFDMPATVLIGEDLTIKGTITEGESVAIYIDDDIFDAKASVTDGVFEEDWDTKGKKTGSYRIDVYIDLVDKYGDIEDNVPGDKDVLEAGIDEDGTTTVRLIEPGLSAEQPRDVIAEEDDYVVEGTATGVSQVDIVIIGPDGYDGDDVDFDLEDGLLFETESVDKDNLFEAEIDTGDADSGKYIVLVLTPGRDGGYGITDYEDGELKNLLTGEYGFDGKSKAQILSMITSVTTEETATDDLMEILEFTIESPYVELDAIEDVGLGEPLIISGTTNREDETVIMVSLTGPVETSATGEVTDNKFNVTIDTTDLTKGVYTVEADDGDGHIATGSVDVGEAAPTATPTPEPTAEPTATAIPTPAATAEPTAEPAAEPTPEPPGFEAIFAIAGMLAIAYLVLRRRK